MPKYRTDKPKVRPPIPQSNPNKNVQPKVVGDTEKIVPNKSGTVSSATTSGARIHEKSPFAIQPLSHAHFWIRLSGK